MLIESSAFAGEALEQWRGLPLLAVFLVRKSSEPSSSKGNASEASTQAMHSSDARKPRRDFAASERAAAKIVSPSGGLMVRRRLGSFTHFVTELRQ